MASKNASTNRPINVLFVCLGNICMPSYNDQTRPH